MTIFIGVCSLCLAVFVAAVTLLVSLAAVRFGSQGLDRAARAGIIGLAGLFSIACAALLVALLQSDFRLTYVAHYTERALPMGYKAAAFWAGQQGSLLLWGWLLSLMGVAFVLPLKKQHGPEHSAAIGVLAAVIGFFILLLFVADPFEAAKLVPPDGNGLNPMLQDPGMIAHPPILFMGYAGFTIPFALLVGSLITGRLDNTWVLRARPWVVVSWVFLGGGILLGANWAYTELGWGGYWAWDPVENASFLPWLTATALLHCMVAQRQRGVFKRWTALLTAATFILCIFGTYITRSGVVDSVHTFGKSWIGTCFGAFLIIAILTSVTLMALRWSKMRPERPMEGLVTREAAFLTGTLLLLYMTAATFVGTMLPAFTKALFNTAQSPDAKFYTYSVLPAAVILLAVMGLAPLLSYGKAAAARLMTTVWIPLGAAAAASMAVMVAGIRNPWAVACAAVSAVVVVAIVVDFVMSAWARRQAGNENLITAAARVIDDNHRMYGAYLAHLGAALIMIGIAGSSLYNKKEMVQLVPGSAGEAKKVGGYTLKLDALREVRKENYAAMEAVISVRDASGTTQILTPTRRQYDKYEDQLNSKVALNSTWKEDLYLTLGGWEDNLSLATIQVVINPLVWWIWTGGWVLIGGSMFCLVPRFMGRAPAAETAADSAETRQKSKRAVALASPVAARHVAPASRA